MTTPPGPPHGDPSPWARPTDQPPQPGEGPQPPQSPEPVEPTTRRLPADHGGQDEPATAQFPGTPAGPPSYPPEPPAGPPNAPAGMHITATPDETPTNTGGTSGQRLARWWRDPLTVVLVVITVLALSLAGLIGGELIGRHIANDKVAAATECVVHDKASASFGMSPPFLWQHVTGNYTNISVETAGNQIDEAKQMKAELQISDVRLHSEGNSGGTIGALDATLTWPSEGIKETIQSMIPLVGNLVTDIATDSRSGTVELKGAFGLGGATVKPEVVNGGLSLKVKRLTGLGAMTLPRETIQPALDQFASMLTQKYPLGIHADSVQVTDTGVVAHFSTRNAPIPSHQQDRCFAGL